MKRFILILIAVVSILGCCKEKPDTPDTPDKPKETTYSIDAKAMYDYYAEACEMGLLDLSMMVVERDSEGESVTTLFYDLMNEDNRVKKIYPDSRCNYLVVEFTAVTYRSDRITKYSIHRWMANRLTIKSGEDNHFKLTKDTPHLNYDPDTD